MRKLDANILHCPSGMFRDGFFELMIEVTERTNVDTYGYFTSIPIKCTRHDSVETLGTQWEMKRVRGLS